jgi:prepilin-type N-terminal cleavage/methylation domain-containing protein
MYKQEHEHRDKLATKSQLERRRVYENQGFTLIELIFSLAILGLMLFFFIPSMQAFVSKNRAITEVNQIIWGLHYTRSEAIQRGAPIIFCRSKDSKTCSGRWQDGQITLDAKGQVLRVFPKLSSATTIAWNSSFGLDDVIKFFPSGFTGQQGSFYYCLGMTEKKYARRIVINHAGRVWVGDEGVRCSS